jgi:hypothetical protein
MSINLLKWTRKKISDIFEINSFLYCWDAANMEKRASRRIHANLELRYPCRNKFCSGRVTNLSENGMFIDTEMDFPVQSKFDILISLREDVLKVPVKISRLVKTDNIYKGMGVELLNLPKKYLEFLIKLNFDYQT